MVRFVLLGLLIGPSVAHGQALAAPDNMAIAERQVRPNGFTGLYQGPGEKWIKDSDVRWHTWLTAIKAKGYAVVGSHKGGNGDRSASLISGKGVKSYVIWQVSP